MDKIIKKYKVTKAYQVGEEHFPNEEMAKEHQKEKCLEEFLLNIDDPVFNENKIDRSEILDFLMDNYNDLRDILIRLGGKESPNKEDVVFEDMFVDPPNRTPKNIQDFLNDL